MVNFYEANKIGVGRSKDHTSLVLAPSLDFDFEEVLVRMKPFMKPLISWIVNPWPPKLNSIIVFYFLYYVEKEICSLNLFGWF